MLCGAIRFYLSFPGDGEMLSPRAKTEMEVVCYLVWPCDTTASASGEAPPFNVGPGWPLLWPSTDEVQSGDVRKQFWLRRSLLLQEEVWRWIFKWRFRFRVLNHPVRSFSLSSALFLHMNFLVQKCRAQEAKPLQAEETHLEREGKFSMVGETGADRKLGARQGAGDAKGKICSR